MVLEIDQEKQRVGLGLKQLSEDPWLRAIPAAYKPGMVVHGRVTKITNFGVFVELEEGLEGLLHISELSDHKVETPQDVVSKQWEIEVNGLPEDFYQRVLDGAKTTTAEDITRIAEEHIDLDKMTIVVVGDAQEVRKDLEKIAPVTLVE